MKHVNFSSKWMLLALFAALAIVTSACSPSAASPQAASAPAVSEVARTEATDTPEAESEKSEAGEDSLAALMALPEIEFFGQVEAMSAGAWTIGGRAVAVTAQTEVKAAIQVGDAVKVHARVQADGSLVAREIEPAQGVAGEPGMLVEFTGVVEAMAADAWTVGGKSVAITAQTEIKGAITVGDTVKVHARVGADGALTAREIELADEGAPDVPGVEVEFRGAVEAMGDEAWAIGGMTFRVTAATEIEAGLQLGDLVKVHARLQSDGSLWAREIEREQERDRDRDRDRDEVEFSGTVESMAADAWVVGGQTVKITAQTEIKDAIEVGDFVRVHAHVEADGSLVAREIELEDGDDADDNGNDNANDNENHNGNINDNGNGSENHNGNTNDNGNDNDDNDNDDNGNGNANDNGNDDNGNGNGDDDNGNDNGNGNGGDDNGNDNGGDDNGNSNGNGDD
jgi:hypothetical protein